MGAQVSLGLQLVMEGRVLGPYHRQQEESSQGGLHDAGHDASQPRRKAQAGATRLSLRAAAAQPQVSTDWKERKGMNPVGLAAEEGQPPRCSKVSKGNPPALLRLCLCCSLSFYPTSICRAPTQCQALGI